MLLYVYRAHTRILLHSTLILYRTIVAGVSRMNKSLAISTFDRIFEMICGRTIVKHVEWRKGSLGRRAIAILYRVSETRPR
jgi:hypothetical protein